MKLNSIPLLFFTTVITIFSSCQEREVADVDSNALIKYHFNDKITSINSAMPTKEGGFIYAGMAKGDGILVLIDATGELQWEVTSGGELDDDFVSVIQTSDGGFLGVGGTNSASLGAQNNVPDGWIVKFTKEGVIEWQKVIGDEKTQRFRDALELPDGNFVLTGNTISTNGSLATWVVKITISGDLLWNRTFDIGPWHDMGKNIGLAPNGNVIVHGLSGKTAGGAGLALFKSNYVEIRSDLGAKISEFFFDQFTRDYAFDLYSIPIRTIFTSEAVVWVSTMVTYDLKSYIHLVKTSYDGTVHFEQKITGLGVADVRSISETSDGGYLITGATLKASKMSSDYLSSAKCLVVKTDRLGNIEWTSHLGDEVSLQYAFAAINKAQGVQIGAISMDKNGIKLMHYALNDTGQIVLNK